MSKLSQFFGGGSQKMDVDVLILSGGGGGAVSSDPAVNQPCGEAWSGSGGGGAVFEGTIPIEPGSTLPIVVGGGGAGHTGIDAQTCINGAVGGCSKITYPEGTICVIGGGAGVHAAFCTEYVCWPAGCSFDIMGGTGGSGGRKCSALQIGIANGTSPGTTKRVSNGIRSIYGRGTFDSETICSYIYPSCVAGTTSKTVRRAVWRGTDVMNHKYGQFSGGASGGGAFKVTGNIPAPPTTPKCYYGPAASGGAGGPGIIIMADTNDGNVYVAGPAVCSCITGTLEEYGRGRVPVGVPTCMCPSPANSGIGGAATECGRTCSSSGGSGVVVVRYPTQFAAAPASPGATNCSPQTPGYHTYRFNSTGSITLP